MQSAQGDQEGIVVEVGSDRSVTLKLYVIAFMILYPLSPYYYTSFHSNPQYHHNFY